MSKVIDKARQNVTKVQGELESWMRRRTTMADDEFKPMIGRYGEVSYMAGFEMGKEHARDQLREEFSEAASMKRWSKGVSLVSLLVIAFEVWRAILSFG